MATRHFSPGVTRATRRRMPTTRASFDRLLPGDLFKVPGEHGRFRFINAAVDDRGHAKWISAFGPIDSGREQFRSFYPDRVQVPSQRALNAQRRGGAGDG